MSKDLNLKQQLPFPIGLNLASESGKGNRERVITLASGAEAAMVVERPMAVTVLIVDDEETARNVCRDVVADSGFRTRTASTTEQALEILEQYPVDIVLTDLRVPQLGGIELPNQLA